MTFMEAPLKGAYIMEPVRIPDERGWFMTAFTEEELRASGLESRWAQCSLSHNARKGTLRGMHFQLEPHAEVKLVTCSRGLIHDVILDLRPGSPTFGRWHATELSEENRRLLYVPKGFAHGFQTLEDGSEVFYHLSASYHPELARGVRWNDSAFAIQWPLEVTTISRRDQAFPDFRG